MVRSVSVILAAVCCWRGGVRVGTLDMVAVECSDLRIESRGGVGSSSFQGYRPAAWYLSML